MALFFHAQFVIGYFTWMNHQSFLENIDTDHKLEKSFGIIIQKISMAEP